VSLADAAIRSAEPDAVDEVLRRSETTFRAPRMRDAADTGAVAGTVRWSPRKSLWISAMTVAALIGAPEPR
jgi:hypothetical protein